MLGLFAPKKPPPGGGNNFDPVAEQYTAAATASARAATSRAVVPAGGASRDGPLLLRVVDDLAQAALKARNDFLAELNAADAQRRDVHAAARARLEQELSQLASSAAKLSDRLFFATRGMINLVRAARSHRPRCRARRARLTRTRSCAAARRGSSPRRRRRPARPPRTTARRLRRPRRRP